MEKPNAFPLREPEFIKLPMTRMISSSWVKFWLLESSSQAAVTDTTSGLMLFSCSSNCSLNRMASSLTFNCFTVDIWQEWRGREVGMRCFLSIDKRVLWEYWRGFFLSITHFVDLNKAACVWFNGATIFCVQQIFAMVSASSVPMLFLMQQFSLLHLWLVHSSQLTGEKKLVLKKSFGFKKKSFALYSPPLRTAPTRPCHHIHSSSHSVHPAGFFQAVALPDSSKK